MQDHQKDNRHKRNSSKYAQRSLGCALVTVALFIVVILRSEITVYPPLSTMINVPVRWMIATLVVPLAGITFLVISVANNEPNHKHKWLGGGLNLLLLIIIVALAFYCRFMLPDSNR